MERQLLFIQLPFRFPCNAEATSFWKPYCTFLVTPVSVAAVDSPLRPACLTLSRRNAAGLCDRVLLVAKVLQCGKSTGWSVMIFILSWRLLQRGTRAPPVERLGCIVKAACLRSRSQTFFLFRNANHSIDKSLVHASVLFVAFNSTPTIIYLLPRGS